MYTVLCQVMDSNTGVLYCAVFATQGRAPPLVSGCRNTGDIDCHVSVQMAQLSNSHVVSSIVDDGGHAHTHSLDDTPQTVLHGSPELMDITGQVADFDFDSDDNHCNSVVSPSPEADVASSDQLQDSDCVSRCDTQQCSVRRLRKEMELLARDEDIPVHCGISTDDDAACCESDVKEVDFEDNLMSHRAHSSDGDTVLPMPSSNIEADSDGLIMTNMQQAARPQTQQELDGSSSGVLSNTVVSGHSHNVAAKGCVVLCFN